MGSKALSAVLFAVLLAGAAIPVLPAAAQETKAQDTKKHVTTDPKGKVVAARPRPPHVIVEKRSFLDAGTEVLPGQRKFLDYAFPPGYSPTAVIDHTTANIRGPLIDPLQVPGHYGWIFWGL